MIVFDLRCTEAGHVFEAWFGSSDEFERQRAQDLVSCAICGSAQVEKAPMAPRLPKKGASGPLSRLAEFQAQLLRESRFVGEEFVDTARAMHSGELTPEQVHGSATLEQAKALAEDGVPIVPLPLPVVPPTQVN